MNPTGNESRQVSQPARPGSRRHSEPFRKCHVPERGSNAFGKLHFRLKYVNNDRPRDSASDRFDAKRSNQRNEETNTKKPKQVRFEYKTRCADLVFTKACTIPPSTQSHRDKGLLTFRTGDLRRLLFSPFADHRHSQRRHSFSSSSSSSRIL